jgi:hypothetical protein
VAAIVQTTLFRTSVCERRATQEYIDGLNKILLLAVPKHPKSGTYIVPSTDASATMDVLGITT